jgi:hypothetical protein
MEGGIPAICYSRCVQESEVDLAKTAAPPRCLILSTMAASSLSIVEGGLGTYGMRIVQEVTKDYGYPGPQI